MISSNNYDSNGMFSLIEISSGSLNATAHLQHYVPGSDRGIYFLPAIK